MSLAVAVMIAAGIFSLSTVERPPAASPGGGGTGYPQLVSVQQMAQDAETCTLEPVDVSSTMMVVSPEKTGLFDAWSARNVYAASQSSGEPGVITRPPVRTIRDTDPIYSAIAVDTRFDEVVLMDNNNWALNVFNRLDNTPHGVRASTPKRVIQGPETDVQFNNGLYIDPQNGDIYSVETDTGDKVVIFPREASGNVKPGRILSTPHRGFALAMDEEKQEFYVGVQYPPEVAVYRKGASGTEKPLRSLQGESTRLSDVHGISIDTKNRLLYVTNWGHVSDYKTPGTGRFEDPSISVYPLAANGDVSPLRIIKGPLTQMNWPAQMAINPDNGDLFVANDMGHSVLVFKGTDQGNVAPTRIIKGDRTGLMNPSGVFVDTKNKELWVSNFGNSSAAAYSLTANGNIAPLRTIRSAPENKVSLKFGKVEALAYDAARDQIWVPNCVTHPQIAAFSRTAKENQPPVRTLEGHKTMLSRTMHGFSYDPIHDELVVNSPLTQAILTFRGSANGEEAPIRVIQGPKTKILGMGYAALSTVTADPDHNEIFLPVGSGGYRNGGTGGPEGIYVFDRMADGDMAPKRMLYGPDTQIRSSTPQVAVDPVHNLLVVKSNGLLIFDRTASGNAKPLRIIRGPKTGGFGGGQIAVYPEKGWILTNSMDSWGIWSINDDGDVAPRWKIPVKEITGGGQNSGIAVIPKQKEIMIASALKNRVLTFYFPEMFE